MNMFGLDTLHLSLEVNNYNYFSDAIEMLLHKKEVLKEMHLPHTHIVIDDEIEFRLHDKGMPFYPIRLSIESLDIYFAKEQTEYNTPIYMKIGSRFLWAYGNWDKAVNKAIEYLQMIAPFKIEKKILSRADLCCDVDDFELFNSLKDKVVTRSRFRATYEDGNKITGYQFGKGHIMLRIYDKSYEIRKSKKLWFNELWEANKMNCDTVTRIEFQLRREGIKQICDTESGMILNTFEDLMEIAGKLWHYLTERWFSLRENNTIETENREMEKEWKGVINVVDGKNEIRRVKLSRPELNHIIPIIQGYLSTAGSLMPVTPENGEKLIISVARLLDYTCLERDLKHKKKNKIA